MLYMVKFITSGRRQEKEVMFKEYENALSFAERKAISGGLVQLIQIDTNEVIVEFNP